VQRWLISSFVALLFAVPAVADTLTVPPIVTFDGKEPIEKDMADRLEGAVENGKLVVHPTDSQSGRKVAYTVSGDGTRVVAVDVSGNYQPDPGDESLLSGAGLVIRHNDPSQSYFLFIATKDGYAIRSVVNGDFGQSMSGSLPDGVEPGGTLRLAARETGDGAEFFVNGQSVGSVSDDGVRGTDLGLIHLGKGDFTFDNFLTATDGHIPQGAPEAALTPAPGPAPAPGPQVGPAPSPAVGPVPPPLLPPANPVFYVAENGKPVGPLPFPDVMAMAQSGKITGDTLVWKDGMPQWAAAKTVPELTPLFH